MVSRPASPGAATDLWIAVFDVLAFGDLRQIGADPFLADGAGHLYEGLVDPGDPCRLARRDRGPRECRRKRTGSSRQRGSRHSRHSFIANQSRASAAVTAFRVSPSASPSSNTAIASVALLREPGRLNCPIAPVRTAAHTLARPSAGRGKIALLIECHFAKSRISIHAIL
jgi:hypothetical protein